MVKAPLDGYDAYEVITEGAKSPRGDVLLNFDRLHNVLGPKVQNGTGNGKHAGGRAPSQPLCILGGMYALHVRLTPPHGDHAGALVRADGMKLVLGDPGPPDLWSEPVPEAISVVAPRGLTRQQLFHSLQQHDDGTLWPWWSAQRNTTVQLFNLTWDISERHDLSHDNPGIVKELLQVGRYCRVYFVPTDEGSPILAPLPLSTQMLDTYASEAVPPLYCWNCVDPASKPSKWGGAWTPWKPNPRTTADAVDGTSAVHASSK